MNTPEKKPGIIARAVQLAKNRLLSLPPESDLEPDKLEGDQDGKLFFGGYLLDAAKLDPHYVICGTTRSGKTVTLRMLLNSGLVTRDEHGTRLRARAFLYDPQKELLPILQTLIPEESIRVLDPFYLNSYRWDVAKDIDTPAKVHHFANVLFPDSETANSTNANFFDEAARGLLRGVMLSFLHRKVQGWTLFHLMQALVGDRERLASILKAGPPDAKQTANIFLGQESKLATHITASLLNKVLPYSIMSKLWHRADHATSLKEWIDKDTPPTLFVITTNESARKAGLDNLNRAMFKTLQQYVVDPPPEVNPAGEYWFLLDELAEAGKLEGLSTLVNQSAKKGGHAVLLFQSISGLLKVYGKDGANELVANCGNKVGLRVNDEPTSEWLASIFGKETWMEPTETGSTNYTGGMFGDQATSYSTGTSKRESERHYIDPRAFMNFPPATEGGIVGCYRVPGEPPWERLISDDDIDQRAGPRPNNDYRYPTRSADDEWDPEQLTEEDKRILAVPSTTVKKRTRIITPGTKD